jgi:hypothetical protein
MELVDLRAFKVVSGKLVANLPPEPVADLPEPEDEPSRNSRGDEEDVGWRQWD